MKTGQYSTRTDNVLQYVVDSIILITHHDDAVNGSGTNANTSARSAGSRTTKKLDGTCYLSKNIKDQDATRLQLRKGRDG